MTLRARDRQVHLLQEYEKSRTKANLAMMAVLDGLQRTFSVQWEPFSLARNLGLDFVNNSGLVKRQMMRFAMGLDEKK